VTASLLVIISLATRPPDEAALRYTWFGATAEEKAATRASWGMGDVVSSGIVLLATMIFYFAFW